MLKRVMAFFMAFVAVFFIFVDCTPRANAVVNPAFVYSAMYSFLLSSGYQFNASDSDGQDVLDMMGDLYNDYLQDDSSALALSEYESGITLTSLGQFAFNYAVVQPLQDFATWIKSFFTVTEGNQQYTTVIAGSGDSADSIIPVDPTIYSLYNNNYISFPLETGMVIYSRDSSRTIYKNGDSGDNDAVVVGFINSDRSGGRILCASKEYGGKYWEITQSLDSSTGEWSTTNETISTCTASYTFNGETFYTSFRSINQGSRLSGVLNRVNVSSFGTALDGNLRSQMGYCALFDGQGLVSSLALRIANTVLDRASQVDQGQSLVVDMGLSAGASVSDAITAVSTGIAEGTISSDIPATSVVSDVVIDTPVQDYPDFDDMGLPELGLALVERFPFCIPYDFVHLVTLFNADPVAPYIRIDLFPQSFRQRIGLASNQAVFFLDMRQEQYQTMGVIIRWGTLVGFCVGLLFITRKLIWSS